MGKRGRGLRGLRVADYSTVITSGLMICAVTAVALLTFTRLKAQGDRLGRQAATLERQWRTLQRENEVRLAAYLRLVSSDGVARRVREMKLDLEAPRVDARVTLWEPAPWGWTGETSGGGSGPGTGEGTGLVNEVGAVGAVMMRRVPWN